MPQGLKALVARFGLHPLMVVAVICAVYVVLGTAMEALSMVLLLMPVFFPVIVHLGFDPVWFGVIVMCVVELGLISPPVGMNCGPATGRGRDPWWSPLPPPFPVPPVVGGWQDRLPVTAP